MQCAKMNVLKRSVSFLLLTVFFATASAQDGLNKRPNVFIDSNCNGYLEYLPIGYTAPGNTQKYPLLVYINGIGTTGNGSASALENHFTGGGYPHEQQRQGSWKDADTVNGQIFQFLIITPQFIHPMNEHIPLPQEINNVINFSIQNYRIDTTRIYLMGSSQGGGAVWDYAGASSAYANRLAAIVPFAGVSFPFQEKSNIMKHAKLAVWAFHNLNDEHVPSSFTQEYVDFYNNAPAPSIPAKKTIINTSGHLCWFAPLRREYAEGGLDVYEWALQYQRTPTTVFAGEDQEIALPANSVQLSGSGTGPNGTASTYNWQKISGPGGNLSNAASANPTANNLLQGTYIYRLTITGNNSASASDDVAITVNPGAQRIEAENYIAVTSGGTVSIATSDGGIKVDAIDNNDWMDYSVTVPTAGNYRFRFRLGTFYGGTQFKVKNSSGTVLASIDTMYSTNWDAFMSIYKTIPLAAGTQTIRFENTGPVAHRVWFINWFEIIDNTVVGTPLPVNFTLFNTNCVNGTINLLWKIAEETSFSTFSVEKSSNGRDWGVVATIAAGGQSFNYTDNATGSNSFYRIVHNDRDGKKSFSSIAKSNCNKEPSFTVIPNPVVANAVLNITLEQTTKLHWSLFDSKGAVVRQQESLLPQGTSNLTINMTGLAKGTYTLYAKWNNVVKSVQLIKN